MFDFVNFTADNFILSSYNENIMTMGISSRFNLLLMQSVSTKYYFYDQSTSFTGTGSTSMTSFIMVELIEIYRKVYILSTTGLI